MWWDNRRASLWIRKDCTRGSYRSSYRKKSGGSGSHFRTENTVEKCFRAVLSGNTGRVRSRKNTLMVEMK